MEQDPITHHLQAARECLAAADAGKRYRTFTRPEHWLAQAAAEVMLALARLEEEQRPTMGVTWKAIANRLQRLHEDLRHDPPAGMTAGLIDHRRVIDHWVEELAAGSEPAR